MASAIGLVVGFVGLAGLFSTCVDCFGWVQLYRSHDEEFDTLQTSLDNQQFLFMAWGKAYGLMDDSCSDSRFNDQYKCRRIKSTMEKIISLLTNADDLKKEYGLKQRARPQQTLALEELNPSAFSRAFQRTKHYWDRSLQRKSAFTTKLLWAVNSAEKFQALIDRLRNLITELKEITKEGGTDSAQRLIVEYEIQIIGDEANLEAISAAGESVPDDAVSSVARTQLEHVKERTAVSRALLGPDDSVSIAAPHA